MSLLGFAYVLLVISQVFDVFTTRRALEIGAREGNWLMAHIVTRLPLFIAVKVASVSIVIAMANMLAQRSRTEATVMVLVVAAGQIAVDINNVKVRERQLQQR